MYQVYATTWDTGAVVEEIPARSLSFTLPLSDHGECSFTATAVPGAAWRAATSPPLSGILVCRDETPVWCGWLVQDEQTGPREFSLRAREWGFAFTAVPPVPYTYDNWNDHAIIRDIFTRAQAIDGQDYGVEIPVTAGAAVSDLTIKAWDRTLTVEGILDDLCNAEGGPEWYVTVTGTIATPGRVLVLGDRLGSSEETVLEHVDSAVAGAAPGISVLTTLSSLISTGFTASGVELRGGNVFDLKRVRDSSRTATATVAVGAGSQGAQLVATAQSSRLLSAGYPRLTRTRTYSDVVRATTLQRHANADLAAACGVLTGYEAVTFDGDPDWTAVPRGSSIRLISDSDVYGGVRPMVVKSRVFCQSVQVPDDGGAAQVTWSLADVLEV